jgi:hypothetical protein
VYHALLFLHVLSAFFLVSGVVMYSAFALGSPVNRATRFIAEFLWGLGGFGTIILGIWLALNRPEYDLLDGWIIAALVLWVLAFGAGARASQGMRAEGGDAALALDRRTLFAHWMRVLYVVLLLLVMVWKPGA